MGATITSNYPVGVDLMFGGLDSYGTRNISILPGMFYSDLYYNPVHQTNPSTPVYGYFYNPLSTPITINYTTTSTSGSLVVPAKSNATLSLVTASGYKFQSAGGESFAAMVIVDARKSAGSTYDWAFSMIGANRLSDFATIAWAPGSTTNAPADNNNPIWVSPTDNATIYVKYNGDLTATGPFLSPCNIPYDVSYPATALQSLRIKNPSGNQSGIAIYSCGVPFFAVYGEDPKTAPNGFSRS